MGTLRHRVMGSSSTRGQSGIKISGIKNLWSSRIKISGIKSRIKMSRTKSGIKISGIKIGEDPAVLAVGDPQV